MSVFEQMSIFGDPMEVKPCDCCYQCKYFAEFKDPRKYSNRDGEFDVFGMCFESYCKNGSYALYPVYIPFGKCKKIKKAVLSG